MFKNHITYFIPFLFCALQAQSYTCVTVASGLWTDDAIWLNGVSPSYKNSDSIIIKHNVELDSSLILDRYAYLRIDSIGHLCGHYNTTVNIGAYLHKYGTLRIDTIFVSGGIVMALPPGDFIMCQGYITLGGSVTVGCNNACIPWDECFPIIGINEVDETQLSIFPNPNNGIFTLQTINTEIQSIIVQNLLGNSAYQNNNTMENNIEIDLRSFAAGVYVVNVITESGELYTKKIVCK
ncbi:MAG: T9SS type A sorting domain-containing protein [Bacteroidia bacterium]